MSLIILLGEDMVKIILTTLVCISFISCSSNNNFRSLAQIDEEESNPHPKVMITSIE
jgi:hypothetical protein